MLFRASTRTYARRLEENASLGSWQKKQQAKQEYPLALLGKATMLAKVEGTAPCVLSPAERNQAILPPLSLLN